VATSAPRLAPELVAALERFDDGKLPIAELRRLVGAEAERLGVPRPSYERVRVLAHEARARRADPTTAQVLWDVASRVRPPDAINKHIAGTLDPK
jgi:DNA-directed RNA polymerase subunit K/omega